jgi:hypothetical protein
VIGRRGFLKALGLAPAVGASAAQRLVGVGEGLSAVFGGQALSAGVSEYTGFPSSLKATGDNSGGAYIDPDLIAKAYLAVNPVPDFVVERMRQEMRGIYRLDPDLAVNRSFSMSAKVMIQREREIDRAIENTKRINSRNLAKKAFTKLHGFDMW